MEDPNALLSRYFEGGLEAEQRCSIEALYEKDAAFREKMEEFYCTRYLLNGLKQAALMDVEAALICLNNKIEDRKRLKIDLFCYPTTTSDIHW